MQNNQYQTQLFNFNNFNLTTVSIKKQPWFIAKDVCDFLSIQNVSQALLNLDEDEKLIDTLHISGQNRQVAIINESGLITLCVRSNKPEAKPFRKWITSEVIPQVLKTGNYSVPKPKSEQIETRRLPSNIITDIFNTYEYNGHYLSIALSEQHGYIISAQHLALGYGVSTGGVNNAKTRNPQVFKLGIQFLQPNHKIYYTKAGVEANFSYSTTTNAKVEFLNFLKTISRQQSQPVIQATHSGQTEALAPSDRNTELISLIINMNQSLINIISK